MKHVTEELFEDSAQCQKEINHGATSVTPNYILSTKYFWSIGSINLTAREMITEIKSNISIGAIAIFRLLSIKIFIQIFACFLLHSEALAQEPRKIILCKYSVSHYYVKFGTNVILHPRGFHYYEGGPLCPVEQNIRYFPSSIYPTKEIVFRRVSTQVFIMYENTPVPPCQERELEWFRYCTTGYSDNATLYTGPLPANTILYGANPVASAKNNGPPPGGSGCNAASASCAVGNPINAATGNKFQLETDFFGSNASGLFLARYYNSQAQEDSAFGKNWKSFWHRSIISNGSTVTVERDGGRMEVFTRSDTGAYVSDPDVQSRLTVLRDPNNNSQIGWGLVNEDDVTETYSMQGLLVSISTRAGLKTSLLYLDAGCPRCVTKVVGPFGHTMEFTYDSAGRVVRATTPDLRQLTYEYSPIGNLIQVSYADMSTRRYLYEDLDHTTALTGIIDEKGIRFASWEYDLDGRAITSEHAGHVNHVRLSYGPTITTVTDTANYNTRYYELTSQYGLVKPTKIHGEPTPQTGGKEFVYDEPSGYLSSRSDWNGNITTYAHDSRGHQTARVEASGTPSARTVTTLWHSTLNLPTRIAEPGRVTTFAYDANGNLLTKTIASGTLTRRYSWTYNALGQVLTATDPRGNVTNYAYDAQGNLASVTNALGHVTQFTTYDGAGRLLRAVDPNGVVSTFMYDVRGRLIVRRVGALATRYTYDAAGNLIRIARPDASFLALTYDPAHRLTGLRDALGNRVVYTLDASGNVTKEQAFDAANVRKRLRSFTYDSVNRLVTAIGAAGQITTFTYDPQGNVLSVFDSLAHTNSSFFDALNRLSSSADPNGGVTAVAYDPLDHITQITDPRGLRTSYAWNGLDDQRSVNSPDTGMTTRTFDTAGNVLTSTDARGQLTSYVYDALNRPTSIAFADGTGVNYQYDQGLYGIGRLTRFTDATGSTNYTYDANGHPIEKVQASGAITLTTHYAYDAGGRLSSVTYPSGKQVAYAYDAAGRVTSVTSGAQALLSNVTWHPFGGATGWTFGNGATYTRTIDRDGRVARIAAPANDNIALTYDAANRITRIVETAQQTKTFGYDWLDRLTNYASGPIAQAYTYDADGNRRTASLTDGATTNSFTYSYPAIRNRLASVGGAWAERFTYDAAGNTLTHSAPSANYEFTYDAKNRLSKATLGALAKTYGINGLGQRLSKANPVNVNDKMLFAYDEAGHLIGEYGPTGAPIQETVWLGDLPVATLQPTENFFIAPDHLGAPHQVTNAAGQVVWLWDHDPFGNGLPMSTGGFVYNLRFPGQYYDAETGLNYNYFRDYDPKLGRYIQSDPIGLKGGINTYAYAGGNSVGNTDPSGLVPPLLCYAANAAFDCAVTPACAATVMACAGTGLSMLFGEDTGDMPEYGSRGAALCSLAGSIPWSNVADSTRDSTREIGNSIRDYLYQLWWQVHNPSTYNYGRW